MLLSLGSFVASAPERAAVDEATDADEEICDGETGDEITASDSGALAVLSAPEQPSMLLPSNAHTAAAMSFESTRIISPLRRGVSTLTGG